ncbi:hypothetical protein HBA92_18090 [Ochrobactrum sp. MR28]|nr:hypothetical protein [Ochrobactrum sp. MR28]MBX8818217.1 hypothetical protein [Ochrobactrum sp. MR31]
MKALFALLLMCGTASAACNDQLIEFVSWSAKPDGDIATETTVVFRSNASKPIKMIDASAKYTDVLGGSIGSFALDRDVLINPGENYTETKRWVGSSFDRLVNLKPEEVTTSVCVKAVLYRDGTKETFK